MGNGGGGVITHADSGIYGQEQEANGPSKFDIERERLCEHSPAPFPDSQQFSANGCQQEPCVLPHPDRFPG